MIVELSNALGFQFRTNEVNLLADIIDYMSERMEEILPQAISEIWKAESQLSERANERLHVALYHQVVIHKVIEPEKAVQIIYLALILPGILYEIKQNPLFWEEAKGLFQEFGKLWKEDKATAHFERFIQKRRESVDFQQGRDEHALALKIFNDYKDSETIPRVALSELLSIFHNYYERLGKFLIPFLGNLKGVIREFEKNYSRLWGIKQFYQSTISHFRNSKAHGTYRALTSGKKIELVDKNPRNGTVWKKIYPVPDFLQVIFWLNFRSGVLENLILLRVHWENKHQIMIRDIKDARTKLRVSG